MEKKGALNRQEGQHKEFYMFLMTAKKFLVDFLDKKALRLV